MLLTHQVNMHGAYLYAHYVDERPIYVGIGSWDRAHRALGRPARWRQLVAKGYRVEIRGWFADRAEAIREEKRLIKELKPSCNLQHNGYIGSKGNKWNLGRRHTAITKALISAGQKTSWVITKRNTGRRRPTVPIKCIDTGEVYPSLRQAAQATEVHYTSISACINGHIGAAGGLRFARAGED